MLNDWSHKVRAILKEYCPGNIKKILPSLSQSGNTRFYFGHQKLCMDNNVFSFVHLKTYIDAFFALQDAISINNIVSYTHCELSAVLFS